MSRTLAALASTPLGAFTPVGPVMATSGDDPLLFGFRLHYASRSLPGDRTLASYGLTTKVQIEGGALIAATVGLYAGLVAVGLSHMTAGWLAPLIIGAILATIGYGLVQKAINTLKDEQLVPERTAESLRDDKEWLER